MRKIYQPLVLFFLFLLFSVTGLILFELGIDEYRLNEEFKKHSVHTPAELIGYEYVHSRSLRASTSGEMAVLQYKTEQNMVYQHVASEYGVVSSYGKKTLPTQKIFISYLPDRPWIARVESWYSSQCFVYFFLSAANIFMIVLFCGAIVRSLNTNKSPVNS